jgi:hypothetical protein
MRRYAKRARGGGGALRRQYCSGDAEEGPGQSGAHPLALLVGL